MARIETASSRPIGRCAYVVQHRLEILLSNHRFELLAGEPCTFRDELGSQYSLRRGRNTIGRNIRMRYMFILVFAMLRASTSLLSRKTQNYMHFIDRSSHGT